MAARRCPRRRSGKSSLVATFVFVRESSRRNGRGAAEEVADVGAEAEELDLRISLRRVVWSCGLAEVSTMVVVLALGGSVTAGRMGWTFPGKYCLREAW